MIRITLTWKLKLGVMNFTILVEATLLIRYKYVPSYVLVIELLYPVGGVIKTAACIR